MAGRLTAARTLMTGAAMVMVLALWAAPAMAQTTCTTTWTGASGGSTWGTAGNWSAGAVPTATDRACIPAGSTVRVQSAHTVGSVGVDGTLEIAGGALAVSDAAAPSEVRALTLSGGLLEGAATVNVSESFVWTGGDVGGTGRTVLESGAVGSIAFASESAYVMFAERGLVNRGTLTFSRGTVYGRDGAWIENEGTFRVNAESSGGLAYFTGAQPTFKNTGTVEKAAGSGRSLIGFRFDNRGAVLAQSGELAFSGGATAPTSDGSWTGSGSARVTFDGGAFSVGRWTLAGNVRFKSGTVTAASLTGPDADVEISGGALSVTDTTNASQLRGLALSGGLLEGAATVNVSESFAWTGGDVGGTGRTVLESGAVGSIAFASESAYVMFAERGLVNRGTLTFSRGTVYGRDGAWIENEGTFRVNAESSGGLAYFTGAQPTFKNTGTVEKTAGSGRSLIGFRFDNRGAVLAQSGELAFSGGATAPTSDGSWTGSGSARVTFDGGAFSVGRWTLAGNVRFKSGTVTAASLTGPDADVEISGGALSVTDTTNASQVRGLALSGGSLEGRRP